MHCFSLSHVFRFLWRVVTVVLLALTALGTGSFRTQASASEARLPAQCLPAGESRLTLNSETGLVRFVGVSQENAIPQPQALPADATPEMAARAYLQACGGLFGLKDPATELTLMSSERAENGGGVTRFQQVVEGIPVLGGELVVHTTASHDILTVGGEILPKPSLKTTPIVPAEDARQRALESTARKHGVDAAALTTTEPQLWVYYPPILGGRGLPIARLVWRMDVEPAGELLPIRELVLVDAHAGVVALSFNQIDTVLNRKVYDNNNVRNNTLQSSANLKRVEGQAATGISDVDKAYDYSGDVYNFYLNTHNRDSLDGAGMALISTTRFCYTYTSTSCPYVNAFWNGAQMVYGDGMVADDVVAHEMTHGVTSFTSGLFYYYQSGAINEAFSDIWGEWIDQTNGKGNDSTGVKWLLGEDLPASVGVIRSMSNPPAYGDPDRMTSTNYTCDPYEEDNGGVHTNSGVANKAAYLITDGGTFNGKTVTGLGITKAAHIFYKAQTSLLTSASDYLDLYNALQQACSLLVGTNGITTADCTQVKNALDAVEMNQQPTGCAAPEAPVCTTGVPIDLFKDDLENPASGKWASSSLSGGNYWFYPQYPNSLSFDATYATSGVTNFWGYNYDGAASYAIAMTSSVALPAGSTPYLHFKHAYGFDDDAYSAYDGGVVEYSTNNGATWTDAAALFTHNGYNGTIYTGYGNPLAGRQAFVRESNGYISSRLNLSSLAGQSVRFRFRIGTDNSVDDYGWFIDDVRIYTCATSLPNKTYLPYVQR
ncbi:M4 family metallopeptidase [Anaerolinea thermophila]|uniref:Thermolysin family peptidase n=1 Tax=Anaerolinea thermophila (strain DSM 14523 / JCM 11388 / NBRC 100420 / UNI-1) TaxID=926569 RepID=E8N180_ANATU|nr:M4 family metallopeptidase [Anaerolinea thermophila]BAJ64823.1 putative thermolysin family peptidase [Anaerolinea thermophila UNI-1]